MKKLIFPLLLVFLCVGTSAHGQSRFYGTVTEVIDGRTIVIEPQSQVKIKIQLQYIEVPEPEQQLHDVIKTHLSKLLLNKVVELRPKNINETTEPIGQILLGGVDVSQQMLRDGAAWYSADESPFRNETEHKIYQHNESLAKKEKRGVWSIPDLKPAWEFRAAKEEKRRQEELKKKEAEEKAKLEKIGFDNKDTAKPKLKPRPNNGRLTIESWFDEVPYVKKDSNDVSPIKGLYGLWYLQHVDKDQGWVGTPIVSFNVFEDKKSKGVFLAAGYDYKGSSLVVGGNDFTIAVGSLNSEKKHLKSDFQIQTDDGKIIKLSKGKSFTFGDEKQGGEFYACKVNRDVIKQIGQSKKATLIVGKYKREINSYIKNSFLALLTVTSKEK